MWKDTMLQNNLGKKTFLYQKTHISIGLVIKVSQSAGNFKSEDSGDVFIFNLPSQWSHAVSDPNKSLHPRNVTLINYAKS